MGVGVEMQKGRVGVAREEERSNCRQWDFAKPIFKRWDPIGGRQTR